jgi:DNA-binding CsgD family transcriptional regulator
VASHLRQFSHQLAAIMPEIGSERLPLLLVRLLKSLVPFDNAVILHYRHNQQPRIIYNDIPPLAPQKQIDVFVNGAFLLDPFYRAAVDQQASGLHRLCDLAPNGFEKTEYYRSYFKYTEIKDEIGFIVQLPGQQFINISMGRLNFSSRFNRTQIALFDDITEVIARICQLQWAVESEQQSAENRLPGQLDSALKHFGTAFLTERETQVVQLFLHGHSTKSIAERLGISPETVKLHRKNSYAKLDVSSQAELFHLFIDSLASLSDYAGGDPLVGYL